DRPRDAVQSVLARARREGAWSHRLARRAAGELRLPTLSARGGTQAAAAGGGRGETLLPPGGCLLRAPGPPAAGGEEGGGQQARRGVITAWRVCARFAVIVLPLMLAPIAQASAQSVADHFRGKTLRILVPSAPGGDRALYPLTFAPFFAKHVPGNPAVQPVFMP